MEISCAKKNSVALKIGQNIRNRRLQLNLTQEKLSFESGLDRTFIGHIERGSRNITVLTLCKVAKALKIKPQDLLKDIDSIPC